MVDRSLTVMQAMAIAVLKGDLVAGYALADLLQETRADPRTLYEKAADIGHTGGVTSYEVYGSPEFQAFCRRFGIAHDARTVSMTITLPLDDVMVVEHHYQGVANPAAAVDTTNLHNERFRTSAPAGGDHGG